ncbi:MAG: DUF3592 domain-containing protein [Bacilli bacterium]|nr:DUF3592 domain-containing protein [Bacilli bacterium]
MQRFMGIILGVLFLGIGIFLYFKTNNLVKNCTVETEAVVVGMKQEDSTDDVGTSYVYYPIIEYDADGKAIRVTMDKGSSNPTYNVGDKLTILYNPNKTNEFIVKGDMSSNIFTILLIAMGVFVTGYGIKVAVKKD